jgi:YVTN family beta-propeller protein
MRHAHSRPLIFALPGNEELALVTNIYDDTLSVIDLSNFKVPATEKVGKGPNGVTYSE